MVTLPFGRPQLRGCPLPGGGWVDEYWNGISLVLRNVQPQVYIKEITINIVVIP